MDGPYPGVSCPCRGTSTKTCNAKMGASTASSCTEASASRSWTTCTGGGLTGPESTTGRVEEEVEGERDGRKRERREGSEGEEGGETREEGEHIELQGVEVYLLTRQYESTNRHVWCETGTLSISYISVRKRFNNILNLLKSDKSIWVVVNIDLIFS